MMTERKTYRAKADSVCFCGRTIRRGQSIQYVKTTEIPPNFLATRGVEYRRQRSHEGHADCVVNWVVKMRELGSLA